ncbi:PDR/VanB family oxidoreductase [Burkholderia contaminans]|uniref:PDR/VanB family oxidoreductase n=1 Tax=Burkholderia contaminans TaxID=488447 RepID=UPI0008F484AF|nr:PDR/VanB family oxidoreductase [Burkholderia contaminans]
MNAHAGTLPVVVTAIEDITPLIKVFTLQDPSSKPLPGFSGGSHVVVLIPDEGKIYRNPYSLMSTPFDTTSYRIGVRRQDNGRGGSLAMHNDVRVGMTLHITHPVNNFPLNRRSLKHIFIAGGVGITPIISQIHDLQVGSVPYELHYAVRNTDHNGMKQFIAGDEIGSTELYYDSADAQIDFDAILGNQPLGSDVYICGPAPMIEAVVASARALGWADSHIHWEEFVEASTGDAFEAFLKKANKRIMVPPELSLLEAIEGAGLDMPYLCRGGACGHCETDVLELDGEIEHRDIWLSDDIKASNRKMMPCVSRAKCKKLVLDL